MGEIAMRFALVAGCVLTAVLGTVAFGQETKTIADPAAAGALNLAVPLDHGWQFRQLKPGANDESGWLPATVPGDVHLDLLANKKIADPFYRDNEAKLQWIENESWEYKQEFTVSAAAMARGNVDLVFEGLDGPATIWLNGAELLKTTNSFRIWRRPIRRRFCASLHTSTDGTGGLGL
jgi:beta-mannosidase